VLTLFTLILLTLGAYFLLRKRRESSRVRARVARYARAEVLAAVRRPGRGKGSLVGAWMDRVALHLERAHLPLRAREYVTILLGAAVTAGLVGALVRGIVGGLITAASAAAAVWLWPVRAAARRRQQFVEALPGALASMAGALRAGQSLVGAMRVVAEEFPEPVGPEFARAVQGIQLGMTPQAAVSQMRRRVDVPEVSYLEAAIALHQQTGSDLGYLLDRTVEALRARMEASSELRALTAQARLSGRVLMVVPLVLAAFMYMVDRDYGATMLGTGPGRGVIAVAVALMVLGRYWIRRITEVF